ncbi:MAG: nitroreductase family protein [Deltaproteobacteria bacterium]|nr:nitroreductase family protein [Deltaproteobacteria bacterium]
MVGDILDVITSRKSIRKYRPDPIPDDMIDKILEAARWAPTGENHQPWRLIVVRDPETRKEISRMGKIGSGSFSTVEYCMGRMRQFEEIEDPKARERVERFMYSGEVSDFLGNAPLLIVVAGACNALDTPYDLSACAENMILEAHSLGLGACWVHSPLGSPRAEMKMKALLDIPVGITEYKALMVLAFGWPESSRSHPRPKKAIEEFVYWEKFGISERPKSV